MDSTPSLWSLPYEADSHGLMSKLAAMSRPVFLDSGHQRGPDRRYDILAAEPVAWIQRQAGMYSASAPDLIGDDSDIFHKINLLRDKYLVNSQVDEVITGSLPFCGGLLGYLGYPTLTGRARLDAQDLFVGVYMWAIVVDHDQQVTTLVALPDCPTAEIRHIEQLLQQDPAPGNATADFQLTTKFQPTWTEADYQRAFQRIKHYIRAGDCYQVNLTQRFTARCSGHPFAAYSRLRAAMAAPFSAYIGWPDGGLLSVSPERFLQCHRQADGYTVLTQPIKGTRRRDNDPERDQQLAAELVSSEKDQAENLMIVDLLRNDLGRVCSPGTIQANQLFALHSFSNVHHLISTVEARLAAPHNALDLLQACYPGGSITGAPKLRAMEIIGELETSPRRVYCGTAFYVSANGHMDSSITIRSLLWEAEDLHCWAGGGIVNDSDADAEYAECFDKISQIINILSI